MSNYSDVKFDSVSIESLFEGLRIISHDAFRPLERTVNFAPLASADKSVMSSAYYKHRKIHVIATLGDDAGKAGMEAAMDTLQGGLQGHEKTFQVSQAGALRDYTATLGGIVVNEYNGGYVELDMTFLCSDPFGYANTSTQLFSTALTGATSSTNFTTIGSAPYQAPVITITLSALTGGTGATITVGNAATGQQVTITRDFVAAEVLVINCRTGAVTVDGTDVAFSGSIPEWSKGAGTMDYSDTFTTRTRSMVAIYNPRYL